MIARDIKSAFKRTTGTVFLRAPSASKMLLPPSSGPLVPRPKKQRVIEAEAREIKPAHLGRAVKEALELGERVLGIAKFHYMYGVYSFITAGLLWLAAGPVADKLQLAMHDAALFLEKYRQTLSEGAYTRLEGFLLDPSAGDVVLLTCRAAALAFLLWRFLQQWTTEIVVTDHRLIYRRGIFTVSTLNTHLAHLSQIDVNQSWLGNLLGYGRVHIYTKALGNVGGRENERLGVQEIYLPAIATPHHFGSLIDIAKTRGPEAVAATETR